MKLNMNKHKDMKFSCHICLKKYKLFLMVNPKNLCKLEFTDHLWIQYLDQPQSNVVFFEIITSVCIHICNITENEISTNDIITFNEGLEIVSTSIIELTNIDDYSYEEALVIYLTRTDLITN